MGGKKMILILLIFNSFFTSCGSNGNTEESIGNTDKVLSYTVSKENDPQCSKWQVPKKSEIIPILSQLEKITAQEWNQCYGDWSCGVEGKLIFRNTEYNYRLDAGGWIILNSKDNQEYYACKEGQSCWESFPSESFCDNEGIIKE